MAEEDIKLLSLQTQRRKGEKKGNSRKLKINNYQTQEPQLLSHLWNHLFGSEKNLKRKNKFVISKISKEENDNPRLPKKPLIPDFQGIFYLLRL